MNNNNNNTIENTSSYSKIKNLEYHSDIIQFIYILKNGYLISCSNDGSLIIYEKDTFDFFLKVKINDYWIYYCIENYINNIIFCSGDGNIYVAYINYNMKNYNIKQIIHAHKASINKIIEFKKKLISVSFDKKMIIFNINNNYDYYIETIIENSFESECIISIKKTNQIISSSAFENSIKFINFYTLEKTFVFKGIFVGYYHSIISKNEEKNLIFVTGTKRTENGLTIINFILFNILAQIKFYDDGFINSLYYINNSDYILIGKKIGDNFFVIKYKIEINNYNNEYELIEFGKIKEKSNEKIRTILLLNNLIIIGSENIKIFSKI